MIACLLRHLPPTAIKRLCRNLQLDVMPSKAKHLAYPLTYQKQIL